MTTMLLPIARVKTSRTAAESGPAALARALGTALRGVESLIPAFHNPDHPARSRARTAWLDKVWWPANRTLDRAEKAMLDDLRRRGVAGAVVGGRLYMDLCRCLDDMGDLTEYKGTNVLIVALADVPDLEIGPDPADARWNAEQTPDHHFDGPTPDEALGDGPADDDSGWDDRAAESDALDRYERGCLLV